RHTRSKRDWSSDVCSSDLAHGDYLTFGAYLAFVADVTLHWGIVAAAAVAILATGALSIGIEFVLWRPLRARRASMMTLFISSIEIGRASCRERVDIWEVGG